MAIGERIRFFRNLRGMTQKHLGRLMGFPERSADVRMAQYETGARSPKANMTEALAHVLNVSPNALNVPNIDGLIGVAHTLFALEDIYGLTVTKEDGVLCLVPNIYMNADACEILDLLDSWYEMATKYRSGKMSKEEYDQWRYYYPKFDTFVERRKRRQREMEHQSNSEVLQNPTEDE